MDTPTCPSWCDSHIIEEAVDGTASDIHRGHVTVGEITLNIEDSPDWPDDCLPIILPDIIDCDVDGAIALAHALLNAVLAIRGDRHEQVTE